MRWWNRQPCNWAIPTIGGIKCRALKAKAPRANHGDGVVRAGLYKVIVRQLWSPIINYTVRWWNRQPCPPVSGVEKLRQTDKCIPDHYCFWPGIDEAKHSVKVRILLSQRNSIEWNGMTIDNDNNNTVRWRNRQPCPPVSGVERSP